MKHINLDFLDNRGQFEELAFSLLKKTYPKIKNITKVNGSGGDEGIDIYINELNSNDLIIFQVKYFNSGRLSPSRRKQIKDSLNTAIKKNSNLKEWCLFISLEMTISEMRWFENKIINKYPNLYISLWHKPEIEEKIKDCEPIRREYFQEDTVLLGKDARTQRDFLNSKPFQKIRLLQNEIKKVEVDNPDLGIRTETSTTISPINGLLGEINLKISRKEYPELCDFLNSNSSKKLSPEEFNLKFNNILGKLAKKGKTLLLENQEASIKIDDESFIANRVEIYPSYLNNKTEVDIEFKNTDFSIRNTIFQVIFKSENENRIQTTNLPFDLMIIFTSKNCKKITNASFNVRCDLNSMRIHEIVQYFQFMFNVSNNKCIVLRDSKTKKKILDGNNTTLNTKIEETELEMFKALLEIEDYFEILLDEEVSVYYDHIGDIFLLYDIINSRNNIFNSIDMISDYRSIDNIIKKQSNSEIKDINLKKTHEIFIGKFKFKLLINIYTLHGKIKNFDKIKKLVERKNNSIKITISFEGGHTHTEVLESEVEILNQ